MCGRIGRPDLTWAELHAQMSGLMEMADIWRPDGVADLAPSWNVKPTQALDILCLVDDVMTAPQARWWFVPDWFKGANADWKQTTFNARIETAREKPTFRAAWQRQRCAIPVQGYYEWTGPKGHKQPHWITTDSNLPLMFLAGLWSERAEGPTCTILTREALPQLADIHSRTPVILPEDGLKDWLSGDTPLEGEITAFGTSWNGRMRHHEVERFGLKDDGPTLIEPVRRLI